MLLMRRHELQSDVRDRIRDGRTDRTGGRGDALDDSEGHSQEDIELAMLQMRTETIVRIDGALGRLGTGEYGACCDCSGEIPESRLRALPFAARCRACQETREESQRQARRSGQRRSTSDSADAGGL
jgi:DnaK suppressor protein